MRGSDADFRFSEFKPERHQRRIFCSWALHFFSKALHIWGSLHRTLDIRPLKSTHEMMNMMNVYEHTEHDER